MSGDVYRVTFEVFVRNDYSTAREITFVTKLGMGVDLYGLCVKLMQCQLVAPWSDDIDFLFNARRTSVVQFRRLLRVEFIGGEVIHG